MERHLCKRTKARGRDTPSYVYIYIYIFSFRKQVKLYEISSCGLITFSGFSLESHKDEWKDLNPELSRSSVPCVISSERVKKKMKVVANAVVALPCNPHIWLA